jgi:hypothetical protein
LDPQIDRHPERAAWREVPDGLGGVVAAADSALVLMAHLRFPAHVGVWLKPEARIIHCSEYNGVFAAKPFSPSVSRVGKE